MINIEGTNYIIFDPYSIVLEIDNSHTSVPYINTIPIDNPRHSLVGTTNTQNFINNAIRHPIFYSHSLSPYRGYYRTSSSYKHGVVESQNTPGTIWANYDFPGYLNKQRALIIVMLIEPSYLKIMADYIWTYMELYNILERGVFSYINIDRGAYRIISHIETKIRKLIEELQTEYYDLNIKDKIKIAIDANHLHSSKIPFKTFRKTFLKEFPPDFVIENLEEVVFSKDKSLDVSEGSKYSKEDKIQAFSSFMKSRFLEHEEEKLFTNNFNTSYLENLKYELLREKEYILFPTERILSELKQRWGILE